MSHINLMVGTYIYGNCRRQPVHWFGLTEDNETMGIICGEIVAKHRQQIKFCNSHLTRNIFNLYMWRFFFGLVYHLEEFTAVGRTNRSYRLEEKVKMLINILIYDFIKA